MSSAHKEHPKHILQSSLLLPNISAGWSCAQYQRLPKNLIKAIEKHSPYLHSSGDNLIEPLLLTLSCSPAWKQNETGSTAGKLTRKTWSCSVSLFLLSACPRRVKIQLSRIAVSNFGSKDDSESVTHECTSSMVCGNEKVQRNLELPDWVFPPVQ